MLPSSELNAAQYSVTHEGIGDHEAAEAMSVFPPSFTQLMKNCHPAVSEGCLPSSIASYETVYFIAVLTVNYLRAAKPTESGDLKTQFMVEPLPCFRQTILLFFLARFHTIVDTAYSLQRQNMLRVNALSTNFS